MLFFIAVLIGGRGSILGPLLGTIILTLLPEFAAPLAAWSTFLYAVLLLVIVLAAPGGIAALLDFRTAVRLPRTAHRPEERLTASLLGSARNTADIAARRGFELSSVCARSMASISTSSPEKFTA